MRKTVVLFVLFCFASITLFAQHSIKNVYQTNRCDDKPIIDGMLDDKCWKNANWQGKFIQHEPYEGREPSQKTEFALFYDDDYIYVGIKAYDANPDSITKRMTRRDEIDGDMVGIQFDSYYDKRTAFTFMVSAAGVKHDLIMSNDGDSEDETWDPIYWVKTSSDQKGWYAEYKIPLTQLRFSNEKEQTWGLQVAREIFRKNELSIWQHIPRDASGWVHNIGILKGIKDIKPKRQVDVIPYALGGVKNYQADPENPFKTGQDYLHNVGVDSKIGITNNLTLDLSINPDFGQIEADPSEVNLTAYESFFREKRPFFIEGRNITSFGVMFGDGDLAAQNMFYSRRIGRRPHYSPDADYTNEPEFTTILAAAKLTGKTANGWSIGIMESLAAEEKAEYLVDGETKKQVSEPLTNYIVGRVQKDINQGNTIIGGILTSTNRDIHNEHLNYLHKNAFTGGVDFTQYFKDKSWYIRTKGMFSYVEGDSIALQETQSSSARYFQRPDADYLTYDSSRTSLPGYAGTIEFGKTGSGKFKFMNAIAFKSPGFEINDLGFMPSVDEIFQVFWVGYRVYEPFSIFRNFNLNLNQWTVWDFGGNNQNYGANINGHTQFKNYWNMSFGVNYNSRNISNGLLRGGPSMITPGSSGLWFWIGSNNQKKLSIGANASIFGTGKDGYYKSRSYNFSLTYRPINTLRITLSPGFRTVKRELQYIDQFDYNEDKRYIFASIDQNIINMSIRINFNITPDLSIQYWGQPFIAAGAYDKFKYITDPKADKYEDRFQEYTNNQLTYNSDIEEYEVDEDLDGNTDYNVYYPDFNFKEFLSNLVIRWEYTPGSTLYLVWSQSRDHFIEDGRFSMHNDTRDLFYTVPQNVLMVKFTYRFGF